MTSDTERQFTVENRLASSVFGQHDEYLHSLEAGLMFLTRLGFDSKAVVTGDITQVDLPKGNVSGLAEMPEIMGDVPGIAVVFLTGQDVVRHELVQHIIRAYERHETRTEGPVQKG